MTVRRWSFTVNQLKRARGLALFRNPKEGAQMKRPLLSYLLFLALASQVLAKVGGAMVQAVTLEDKAANITVLNQSDQDITGFTLAITATFTDGHQEHSEYTRDYGPLTGNVLPPHQVVVQPYSYGSAPTKVDARVIIAIYKDGTAEADDKRALDQVVSVRASIAKALQVSADTLNAALATTSPTDYASRRLKEMLAANDKTINQSYLKGSVQLIEAAPKGGERQYLQEHAARYQREANAFAAYANVRRLP